jgi:hypothetical protein
LELFPSSNCSAKAVIHIHNPIRSPEIKKKKKKKKKNTQFEPLTGGTQTKFKVLTDLVFSTIEEMRCHKSLRLDIYLPYAGTI